MLVEASWLSLSSSQRLACTITAIHRPSSMKRSLGQKRQKFGCRSSLLVVHVSFTKPPSLTTPSPASPRAGPHNVLKLWEPPCGAGSASTVGSDPCHDMTIAELPFCIGLISQRSPFNLVPSIPFLPSPSPPSHSGLVTAFWL